MPSPTLPCPAAARFLLVFACLASFVFAAEQRAFVFVGLATNDTQAARFLETAESVQEALCRRGFDPASVSLYAPEPGHPLRREKILAALAPKPAATPADETWIILLGTVAADRSGQPAFQITGPRLTAHGLATAIGALPGKKSVVVATSAAGGFLPPLLALPDVEAVAATAATGQISEPRFAAFWAEALAAEPHAPFPVLAARAAERVAAYYTENSFAQSETARLVDRASGRILEAPFSSLASPGKTEHPPGSPLAPSSDPAPTAPTIDISALKIPKATGETEVEHRPADDESRALLAAALASAADSAHAALILRTEVDLLVASDFSSRETWRTRAYLRRGDALDDLGTLHLGGDSTFTQARLVTARVIRPDASQLVLNPAARSARLATEVEAGRARDAENVRPRPSPTESPSTIYFPEVTAGCLVEAEWTIEHRADGELPEFYREWRFAAPYPQKSLRVSVTVPDQPRWRAFAPTLPAPARTNSTRTWTLADIPAHEPLPGDPPARGLLPWVGVSSVDSWEMFAACYRRLAADSDRAGPGIEALAAEIAAAHPDRAGRLRAAYERVAALRYVAIELGVGAFRPRTPEQVWRQRHGDCKDKANLLVAVLAKLGIPAEFALVNRFDTTFTDFPGWQFNHALARVPAAPAAGQPHDLWLDTTDRLVPFGVVAPGDHGREAFVFSAGFASAAFHLVTAAQEPPAIWREDYAPGPSADLRQLRLSASGSAEAALRRLFANLGPIARRERLRALLSAPVTTLDTTDPYDLSTPFVATLLVPASSTPPRPLIPGLETYLGRETALWDDAREWTYLRTGHVPETRTVPARLPLRDRPM